MRRVFYDGGHDALIVELEERHLILATLPWQPVEADHIVFKRVGRGFCPSSLKGYYDSLRESLGLADSVIFLTSARVDDYIRVSGGRFEAIATVGLEPPVCPGSGHTSEPLPPSTVNIAVLVDAGLSSSAMADLLRTVAEAKCLAMTEVLLRCRYRSPGTVSDAIAVGRPASLGEEAVTAGMATTIGGEVSEGLYRALVDFSLERLGLEGVVRNCIGLGLGELEETAMRAYSKAPVPGVEEGLVKRMISSTLRRILRDPNVAALIIASRELDLHGASGSIPGLSREEFSRDPRGIVADELLGAAAALYIAGFKGLLAAYWVDRIKGEIGVPGDLGVFSDDMASAIVGSVLALVYDVLLGRRGD